MFPWDNRFANISINKQEQLFTQTFQNIMSNYIPHETITCDDRKRPWMDEKIKKLVRHKNCAFNSYSWDKNNADLFKKFQSPQAHLKTSIEKSNQNYYSHLSNKLLDGKTSPKLYWSILKTFLNNKKLYFNSYTMANLSRTLRKRLNSLMTSLQGSVLLLITTVNLKKHVSYFWQLSFQHMISYDIL